jgi:hypothetical protein
LAADVFERFALHKPVETAFDDDVFGLQRQRTWVVNSYRFESVLHLVQFYSFVEVTGLYSIAFVSLLVLDKFGLFMFGRNAKGS